jgi:hypothetical protein
MNRCSQSVPFCRQATIGSSLLFRGAAAKCRLSYAARWLGPRSQAFGGKIVQRLGDGNHTSEQPNRDRMRPVAGAQFAQDILHVNFDGAERSAQLIADFLIASPLRGKPENLDFARRQARLRKAFPQFPGDLRTGRPFPGMNNPNRLGGLRARLFFQTPASSAR